MIAVRRASGNAESPDADRTLGVTIDDAGITVRVKTRLLEDPLVKGLAIDVDTRAGVVYLTGNVRTAQEKDQAIRLARETQGVEDYRRTWRFREVAVRRMSKGPEWPGASAPGAPPPWLPSSRAPGRAAMRPERLADACLSA